MDLKGADLSLSHLESQVVCPGESGEWLDYFLKPVLEAFRDSFAPEQTDRAVRIARSVAKSLKVLKGLSQALSHFFGRFKLVFAKFFAVLRARWFSCSHDCRPTEIK